jgi:uroporphyrinogen-III decarboxylase
MTRSYWGIEDVLHYCRDVTLREDYTRLMKDQAGKTMACLNNLILVGMAFAVFWGTIFPVISEARKRTALTLMGGIDHVKFAYISTTAIRDQVKSARSQAGKTKLILACGCSIPTYSFPLLIKAAREAAREQKR